MAYIEMVDIEQFCDEMARTREGFFIAAKVFMAIGIVWFMFFA